MCRRLAVTGACAVALALPPAGRADARAGQRFTASADAVRVDVLVTDRGQPVTGLSARDFEVRDDGRVQRIEQVSAEQLPLDVIFVFDTSGSVSGERLAHLAQAVRAAAAGLAPGDRVAVVTFSNRVHLLSPFTEDREVVQGTLAGLAALGRTTLRDGVFAGLALRDTAEGRALLLLFTDGEDTGSWLTKERVLEAARRSDVVAYAVAVKPPSGRYGEFLADLADTTGGRIVSAETDEDLQPTFLRVLSEFRHRYVLTYQPSGVVTPGWHRLEVRLKGRRGTIVARRGYFFD